MPPPLTSVGWTQVSPPGCKPGAPALEVRFLPDGRGRGTAAGRRPGVKRPPSASPSSQSGRGPRLLSGRDRVRVPGGVRTRRGWPVYRTCNRRRTCGIKAHAVSSQAVVAQRKSAAPSRRRSGCQNPSTAPAACGPMEKAPGYGPGECRFDPCRADEGAGSGTREGPGEPVEEIGPRFSSAASRQPRSLHSSPAELGPGFRSLVPEVRLLPRGPRRRSSGGRAPAR